MRPRQRDVRRRDRLRAAAIERREVHDRGLRLRGGLPARHVAPRRPRTTACSPSALLGNKLEDLTFINLPGAAPDEDLGQGPIDGERRGAGMAGRLRPRLGARPVLRQLRVLVVRRDRRGLAGGAGGRAGHRGIAVPEVLGARGPRPLRALLAGQRPLDLRGREQRHRREAGHRDDVLPGQRSRALLLCGGDLGGGVTTDRG